MGTYRIGEGMPGGAVNTALVNYINPRPDPRINDIVTRSKSGLRQGLIQQTDEVVAAGAPVVAGVTTDAGTLQGPYVRGGQQQKHPFACRFMFNPTTLSFTYGSDQTAFDKSRLTADESAATDVSPGSSTLAFELLFDRTFEVAFGPLQGGGPAWIQKHGVMVDIHALERVVGVRFPFASHATKVIQPMRLIPTYFIFGGGHDNVGITWVGHINMLTVTYTSFSTSMVPIRAAVTINATQLLGRTMEGQSSTSLFNLTGF